MRNKVLHWVSTVELLIAVVMCLASYLHASTLLYFLWYPLGFFLFFSLILFVTKDESRKHIFLHALVAGEVVSFLSVVVAPRPFVFWFALAGILFFVFPNYIIFEPKVAKKKEATH